MRRRLAISVLICVGLFAAACDKRFTNRGEGMAPTIKDGEHVVATLLLTAPPRGDIVFFKSPADQSKLFVKRVIGLPGDRIESRSGQIFINGQPLAEPY